MPPKRIRLVLGGSRHQSISPNAIPTRHNLQFDEVIAPGTGDMNDNEEGSEEEAPQSTQQSTMESQHIYPPQVQLSRTIASPPESSDVDESIGRLGGRQPGHRNWQSYQERMLVSLVLEEKPFFTRAAEKWNIIASKLKKPTQHNPSGVRPNVTGNECQKHFDKVYKAFQVTSHLLLVSRCWY